MTTSTNSGSVAVLCTRPLNAEQQARLRAVSPRLQIEVHQPKTRADVASLLRSETEILVGTLTPESLATAPGLRWVQLRGAGVNHLVGSPLWKSAVAITTGSGVHGITMAEYTLGMMIALTRDFLGFISHQQRACWPMTPKVHYDQFPGRELRGSTALIVGYGSIGREIGRQCHALGLRILAVKRDPSDRVDRGYVIDGTGDPSGSLPEKWLAPSQLNDFLPEADYVILATAATAATRHLIGADQLRRMKPDAFLINVARGEVIDQPALVQALQEHRIGGAALDVFDPEPLPADHPLWRLDNVIISPHIAGITPRYDDHWVGLVAENLRRYLLGRPLLNLVDREHGY